MSENKANVVVGGQRKRHLAASLLGLSAALCGPYSMQDIKIPKHSGKTRTGALVYCSVCGKYNVTLRKADGNRRVCQTCYQSQISEEDKA